MNLLSRDRPPRLRMAPDAENTRTPRTLEYDHTEGDHIAMSTGLSAAFRRVQECPLSDTSGPSFKAVDGYTDEVHALIERATASTLPKRTVRRHIALLWTQAAAKERNKPEPSTGATRALLRFARHANLPHEVLQDLEDITDPRRRERLVDADAIQIAASLEGGPIHRANGAHLEMMLQRIGLTSYKDIKDALDVSSQVVSSWRTGKARPGGLPAARLQILTTRHAHLIHTAVEALRDTPEAQYVIPRHDTEHTQQWWLGIAAGINTQLPTVRVVWDDHTPAADQDAVPAVRFYAATNSFEELKRERRVDGTTL